MIKFTSHARTLQLALATAVLLPMSASAETPMTARQMLAHAQTQALNVPSDIKKPAPDSSERIVSESAASGGASIAAPFPVIEPPTPISAPATTLTALAVPVPAPEAASSQTRTNSLTAAVPVAEAAKTSNPVLATPPVAATTETRQMATAATRPVAAAASPALVPATAPVAATPQSGLPAAVATQTTGTQPAASSSAEKPAPARRQPTRASSAAARPAPKPTARSSRHSDEDAISTRISRIMRRPDVQSLMSQYGLD
ncbi:MULTISPECIES: hypothetical protein [unclassified Bradyrhizobium]|uniref:hypothetical protein n=1 Tax=unclassified Bradyrhizobium TaxID=2631580 RepID=UPI0028E9CF0E|nr:MULTISPECIES: hypothetical protein [unclassified Bradyrhizobium]